MSRYSYKKIDAFTSGQSLGNPAASLFTGNISLSEEQMQMIATQHKGFVSEVVYCEESEHADCKLTYFSSECEVDFCGHGTIATVYDYIKQNKNLLEKSEITFETNKKGILKVYNQLLEEDAIYITAPEPNYLEAKVSSAQIADALGIEETDILDNYKIGFIDAGLRTLIVPIKKLEKEISIYPNEMDLKEFCLSNEIDIILIFCMEVSDAANKAHTRVFAPKFGYLEDPATGSGNSAFGYYMQMNQMWDGEAISIEQGGNNCIYNIVKMLMKEKAVLFGGSATTRIEGEYIVD